MAENRDYQRNELVEIVGAYLILPSKGEGKIKIKDINESGLAFYCKPGGTCTEGDSIQVYFHITEKIKLPLSLKIVYSEKDSHGIRIGCEVSEAVTPAVTAFKDFARFINSLSLIY